MHKKAYSKTYKYQTITTTSYQSQSLYEAFTKRGQYPTGQRICGGNQCPNSIPAAPTVVCTTGTASTQDVVWYQYNNLHPKHLSQARSDWLNKFTLLSKRDLQGYMPKQKIDRGFWTKKKTTKQMNGWRFEKLFYVCRLNKHDSW